MKAVRFSQHALEKFEALLHSGSIALTVRRRCVHVLIADVRHRVKGGLRWKWILAECKW